jgi:hypothetical protein
MLVGKHFLHLDRGSKESGTERHDDFYHPFIARARAQP